MLTCFACVVMLLLAMICYQYYCFAASRTPRLKQKLCQYGGVAYLTLGVLCLVYRTPLTALLGIVLLMLGLRLVAHGLDRADKTIFIDRYRGDERTGDQQE